MTKDIRTLLTDEQIAVIASEFDIDTIPGMLNHAFACAIEQAVLAASSQAVEQSKDAERFNALRFCAVNGPDDLLDQVMEDLSLPQEVRRPTAEEFNLVADRVIAAIAAKDNQS